MTPLLRPSTRSSKGKLVPITRLVAGIVNVSLSAHKVQRSEPNLLSDTCENQNRGAHRCFRVDRISIVTIARKGERADYRPRGQIANAAGRRAGALPTAMTQAKTSTELLVLCFFSCRVGLSLLLPSSNRSRFTVNSCEGRCNPTLGGEGNGVAYEGKEPV